MTVAFKLCAFLVALPAAALAHAVGPPSPLALARDDVVARIQGKVAAGEDSPETLAPEFAEFETIFSNRKPEDQHDAGDLLAAQLGLTIELFDDYQARSLPLLQKLQAEFPETDTGTALAEGLARRQVRQQQKAAQAALLGQPAPALAFQWSSRRGLGSLEDLRGKVVVLDFWSTGSIASVRAFSALRTLVEHYADQPVEIVAVSAPEGSISGLGAAPIGTGGDPTREQALLAEFARNRDVTWTLALTTADAHAAQTFAVPRLPYRIIIGPDGIVRASGLPPADRARTVAEVDALLGAIPAR